MKLNATTNQIATTKITITGKDILELLKAKYPEHFRLSTKSKVTFQVPGGGDYSNMELDIDSENPIHIELITESSK
jgi:hypothetical protein